MGTLYFINQIRRRSIVARKLNRSAWTPQVLEAVVGWVASTVGTVEVEAVVVVVAGAQLLSCVPRVLARIHSLLAVTLPTNHQLSVVSDVRTNVSTHLAYTPG